MPKRSEYNQMRFTGKNLGRDRKIWVKNWALKKIIGALDFQMSLLTKKNAHTYN